MSVHPSRLDLEQARKRAKELLRAARAGDEEALRRIGERDPKLADAQRAIARELGYRSWPRLVEAAETPTPERFVRAAFTYPSRARRLLERAPALADDPWCALCLGDASAIADARTPGGPLGYAPLFHVCHSLVAEDPADAARELLARGADPNVEGEGGWTALSSAAGRRQDPELVRALLEAGADPDDGWAATSRFGDSLYHSVEVDDPACTRLLLEHGASVNGTMALAHALDYDRLERVRLLLDHGADPNEGTEGTSLHHAVKRQRGPEFVRLLAERGADLDATDGEGRTAYAHAVRAGRHDVMRELAELGAATAVSADDELVGAIARGERPARAPLLDRDAREVIVDAAVNRAALDAVLELYGVDLRGWGNGTLLHAASWHGKPEPVERLLRAGSDVHARADTEYDTPLAWAAHGSRYGPPGDHVGVAELLVEAGAEIEPRFLDIAAGPLAEWLEERMLRA